MIGGVMICGIKNIFFFSEEAKIEVEMDRRCNKFLDALEAAIEKKKRTAGDCIMSEEISKVKSVDDCHERDAKIDKKSEFPGSSLFFQCFGFIGCGLKKVN